MVLEGLRNRITFAYCVPNELLLLFEVRDENILANSSSFWPLHDSERQFEN